MTKRIVMVDVNDELKDTKPHEWNLALKFNDMTLDDLVNWALEQKLRLAALGFQSSCIKAFRDFDNPYDPVGFDSIRLFTFRMETQDEYEVRKFTENDLGKSPTFKEYKSNLEKRRKNLEERELAAERREFERLKKKFNENEL